MFSLRHSFSVKMATKDRAVFGVLYRANKMFMN